MFLFYAILVLISFPNFGHAGPTDYYCTIKQDLELSNDGKFRDEELTLFRERFSNRPSDGRYYGCFKTLWN